MGRRYYKRHDIHIIDFYYWNPSGTGAGIDNYKLGQYFLSYAFTREDTIDQPDKANRHDFNLGGIEPNTNGDIELGLSVIQNAGSNTRTWRVLESPIWQITPNFGGALLALMQKTRAPDNQA